MVNAVIIDMVFQPITAQRDASHCARFCKIRLKLAYSIDEVPQRYTRATKLLPVTLIL